MAHDGQEGGLGLIGGIGQLLGTLQFLLRLLAQADIAERAQQHFLASVAAGHQAGEQMTAIHGEQFFANTACRQRPRAGRPAPPTPPISSSAWQRVTSRGRVGFPAPSGHRAAAARTGQPARHRTPSAGRLRYQPAAAAYAGPATRNDAADTSHTRPAARTCSPAATGCSAPRRAFRPAAPPPDSDSSASIPTPARTAPARRRRAR